LNFGFVLDQWERGHQPEIQSASALYDTCMFHSGGGGVLEFSPMEWHFRSSFISSDILDNLKKQKTLHLNCNCYFLKRDYGGSGREGIAAGYLSSHQPTMHPLTPKCLYETMYLHMN